MTDTIAIEEVELVYALAGVEIEYYLPAKIRNYNWSRSDDAAECADCGGVA